MRSTPFLSDGSDAGEAWCCGASLQNWVVSGGERVTGLAREGPEPGGPGAQAKEQWDERLAGKRQGL